VYAQLKINEEAAVSDNGTTSYLFNHLQHAISNINIDLQVYIERETSPYSRPRAFAAQTMSKRHFAITTKHIMLFVLVTMIISGVLGILVVKVYGGWRLNSTLVCIACCVCLCVCLCLCLCLRVLRMLRVASVACVACVACTFLNIFFTALPSIQLYSHKCKGFSFLTW
jgi:hypothetical protein